MSNHAQRLGLLLVSGTFFLATAGSLGADDAGPPPGTYRIVSGKLDKGAYAGWFTYHLSCFMCHGEDATGTDVAPDLRKSLKTMSQMQFANKILVRYRILGIPGGLSPKELRDSVDDEVSHQRRGPAGTITMPVWPDDPGMKPHILDLYAYLKARSDNALGPGRPKMADE
jgi:hypothetical protein